MRFRRRRGQTLIEVTMATMIAAITTTAVFSVVLSSFVSDNRADKRAAAAAAMRLAQESLKGFVSVEPYNASYSPTSSRGVGRWSADTSNVWALRDGRHTIDSVVQQPNSPLAPAGATAPQMYYDVQSYDCLGTGMGAAPDFPRACKRVTFTITYAD